MSETSKTKREINMLEGSLWDKILRFALPLAVTGILQQLFNAADIAVVGRFTGEKGALAMAAVGANTPVISLILNLFIGISLGTNVVIANSVGRRDNSSINKAVHTSIAFALIGGFVISVIGELLAKAIMLTQNVPDEVLPMAVLYFRVYMIGMPVILLYNFESAVFRGIGNPKMPLIALFISGILNVLLNLLFVLGFHRTVDGVAMATVISNMVSSAILFLFLLRADNAAKLQWRKLRIDLSMLARILRIGIPAGIQSAVFAFANIIIQTAINSLGTIVMAASSAAYNVEVFAYYVLNSFSQACTTFVGQNYGAGKIRRCKKAMGLCMLEGIIAMASAIAIILIFGHSILSIFNAEPKVIETGYLRLVVIFSAYIFTLLYEVISGYMRGFGISVMPAFLTMLGICGVRITWIYTVFPKDRTFSNIMMAYPFSLSVTAAFLIIALLCLRPAARASVKSQRINE